ncbi:MAG TPA: glycosyltransferase 87 family protein [Actinomycetota bacterium]
MGRDRTLSIVLGVTLLTLTLGFLQKAPCLGPWDGRQYTLLCYSDIVPLFHTERLDEGAVPYLEADNEYPVLTGMAMALAGVPADSPSSFFVWNALMLAALGLMAAAALARIAGRRALLFAAAPTLLIYAFVNWDLVAVAAATLGTWAFLRRRDGLAGLALGVGAAAKLYPALLVIPFALHRLGERRADRAGALTGAAAGAWVAINLPFALLAPERWSIFFRFSAERPADWDSLWHVTQRHLSWPGSTEAVNLLSGLAFGALAAGLWLAASRTRPGFPAWTFGFPLLVAFLITGKVYSPQFSLWLLPWFALALPHLPTFLAFSAAEVAVFVTRFRWFAEMAGQESGVPFWAFEAAILVRAAVLVWALVLWVRRPTPQPEPERRLQEAAT